MNRILTILLRDLKLWKRITAFSLISGICVLTATGKNKENTNWSSRTSEKVEQRLSENRAVLVAFHANWSLTSVANRKHVFEDPEILEFLKEKGILLLEADWTNHNSEVKDALKELMGKRWGQSKNS